ncbi:MAG: hypothetical protein R3E01_19745 [Pirellulaceae bacterium]
MGTVRSFATEYGNAAVQLPYQRLDEFEARLKVKKLLTSFQWMG